MQFSCSIRNASRSADTRQPPLTPAAPPHWKEPEMTICPCCAGADTGYLLDLCGPCLAAYGEGRSETCAHRSRLPMWLRWRAAARD